MSIFYAILLVFPFAILVESLKERVKHNTLFVFGFFAVFFVINFFVAKLAMSKVFFKPYKNFSITPKFAKVPNKLIFIMLFAHFIIMILMQSIIELGVQFLSTLQIAIIALIINACFGYLIFKYIIEKYSEISNIKSKIVTQIIHD